MAIQLNKTQHDGNWVIAVSGEVDLYTSPDLRREINHAVPASKTAVGVDLSGVGYMDSSGVATLVEGLRSAGDRKMAFVLVSPSEPVMKVLQLTRLDSVFTIQDAFSP